MRFDLDALTASASSLLMVPIFVLALLAARGLPAIVYRGVLDAPHTAIAGLMLATSLACCGRLVPLGGLLLLRGDTRTA